MKFHVRNSNIAITDDGDVFAYYGTHVVIICEKYGLIVPALSKGDRILFEMATASLIGRKPEARVLHNTLARLELFASKIGKAPMFSGALPL